MQKAMTLALRKNSGNWLTASVNCINFSNRWTMKGIKEIKQILYTLMIQVETKIYFFISCSLKSIVEN